METTKNMDTSRGGDSRFLNDDELIDETKIVRVYSGKPGCGCGCNGRYFEDERNIRRVVRKMNASEKRGVQNEDRDPIYYVENSRYLWAYTKA